MLVSSLLFIISSNAVAVRRDKSILYARTLISILICCLIINYNSYYLNFLGSDIGIFHGLFHMTPFIFIFHMFIFVICVFIIQLYGFYPRKLSYEGLLKPIYLLTLNIKYFNSFILNKMSEQFKILEYSLLMLFVIVGGVFLIACSDLISIFLCIELQSYGLYILCSVYKESEKATSAGLTYFLLGGLSSCFILFASSIIYSNLGNTNFDSIYVLCSLHDSNYDCLDNIFKSHNHVYINIAFAIMSVGFLFKVTAAPFHFWSPDVYDAIPTSVTTFVAIFAKISIFVLLVELIYYTNTNSIYGDDVYSNSWKFTLLLSSLCSFVIGSILGMVQYRVKRLYAYSTISHVGFILLGISINSIESIQSFIFYLMQYSLSNLNAFLLLIAMGYSLYTYIEKDSDDKYKTPLVSDRKNSPIQLINQLTGFFYINPVLAISFGLTIFSFVGVPPLIGFFGKQMVLSSALDNGYVFIVLVAILTSVISSYYYLSLVKQIFFSESNYIKNPQIKNISIKCNIVKDKFSSSKSSISAGESDITISSHMSISISLLTLIIMLFIFSPQEWLSMINILSVILFNN